LGLRGIKGDAHQAVNHPIKRKAMKKFLFFTVLVLSFVAAQGQKTVADYWKLLGDPYQTVTNHSTDLKNDYISYSGRWEGGGEFAVWRKKNGTDLIGDSSYGCGPACFISRISFREPKGTGFADVTKKMLPEMEFPAADNPALTVALQKKLLPIYNRKTGENFKNIEQMSYYIKLPRVGTTITIRTGEFTDTDPILAYYKFNGSGFTFELAK
jgi:hypothetical protein